MILLYDADAGTVLLTRQFRLPTYLNGHPTGQFLEAPAGLLDDDDPESAIRREAHEETGVTVDEVEHLFEPFRRSGTARTARRGAGLGLAIVRAVAGVHGGTVTAQPRDGGGLVLRIELPALAVDDGRAVG